MEAATPPPPPSPGGPGKDEGRFRSFVKRRPVLATVITGIVALLIGVGIGGGATQSEVTDLENEVASLETDLSSAEDDAGEAEDAANEAENEAAEAREAIVPLEKRVSEFEKQKDDLAAQQEELAAQGEDLEARESEISAAENTLEANTITDGTWQLGVDYEAGTYEAEGGGGCYWEKLNSPSGKFGDIIANGGFGPNQTLVIDSPYFHTDDCGDWVPVG